MSLFVYEHPCHMNSPLQFIIPILQTQLVQLSMSQAWRAVGSKLISVVFSPYIFLTGCFSMEWEQYLQLIPWFSVWKFFVVVFSSQ
jgi:hypothetical protein